MTVLVRAALAAAILLSSMGAIGASAQPRPIAPPTPATGQAPPAAAPMALGSPAFSQYLEGLAAGQMELSGVPGLGVAIVSRDGVRIARAYGYGNAAGKATALDAQQTVLPIASISKTFIAVALMRAQEKGLLSLDDPANKHLDFKLPTYPGAREITLRDLARHEAGFEERWLATGAGETEDPRPWSEIMAKTYPEVIAPPGTWSSYSNYGASLLAYIVERATGMPYDRFLQQEVFDPIGMTSSSVEDVPPPAIAGRVAVGWTVSNGVVRASSTEAMHNKRTAPAGRVNTTLPDLQAYMLTLLNGGIAPTGTRVLSEASVRTLLTATPTFNRRMPGMGILFAEKEVAGLRFIGHGGDGGDRHTDMILSPERGVGIVTIFLSAPGPHARDQFTRPLIKALFPEARRDVIPLPEPAAVRSLGQFAGDYRHYRWAFTSIEKILGLSSEFAIKDSGKGTLIVTGRLGAGEYVPVSGDPNVFQNRLTHDIMAFRPDPKGPMNVSHGTFPFMTAYKLQVIDTQAFTGKAYLAFVLGLCGLGIALLALSTQRALGGARRPAVGTGLLGLTVLINGAALHHYVNKALGLSEPAIQQAIPDFARFALAIPIVSLAAVAAYGVGAALGPFRPKNRLEAFVAGSALVLFGLFIAWLAHWNALGWNFP